MSLAIATSSRIDPMIPQPWNIKKIKQETHDTFTLELSGDHTSTGGSFKPGQFNMLYLFGVGEVPISISGPPDNPNVMVHTIRAVGSVTKAMRSLRTGDQVGVRGPFGTHWPVESAGGKDVVIVTGGIGLAPLRPVMYHLLANRDRFQKVVLLYGARTPDDILYRHEVESWKSQLHLEVHVTVDRGSEEWRGNVGVVTTLIPQASFDPPNTVAMICGPEIMMRFTLMELQKRGLKSTDIYVSMERNMKCAIGFCGHCQYGPNFICKEGPVFRFDRIQWLFHKREI